MIGFLQGNPISYKDDTLVINVRGVGYEVQCSQFTREEAMSRDVVQLLVHTHVREDQMSLFGFLSINEKQLFLSLIKVNGIGPKLAINVLSAAPADKILGMIERGDVKALTQLPKVGKKTAEQMILSLKGKLVLDSASDEKKQFVARTDIVSALVNLGFKLNDVETVVDKMETGTDLQEGVRKGLVALTTSV